MECLFERHTQKIVKKEDYIPVPERLFAEQLQKKIVYDWDSNILLLRDKYNNNYNLRLRGNKNIIYGEGGIGKSYMCQRIKQIQSQSGIGDTWNADNIIILDRQSKEFLGEYKHKLIIVDNAEFFIFKKEEKKINLDCDNRYIFFTNKTLGLGLTPNHYGEMILTANNTHEIQYKFNVKNWL